MQGKERDIIKIEAVKETGKIERKGKATNKRKVKEEMEEEKDISNSEVKRRIEVIKRG